MAGKENWMMGVFREAGDRLRRRKGRDKDIGVKIEVEKNPWTKRLKALREILENNGEEVRQLGDNSYCLARINQNSQCLEFKFGGSEEKVRSNAYIHLQACGFIHICIDDNGNIQEALYGDLKDEFTHGATMDPYICHGKITPIVEYPKLVYNEVTFGMKMNDDNSRENLNWILEQINPMVSAIIEQKRIEQAGQVASTNVAG